MISRRNFLRFCCTCAGASVATDLSAKTTPLLSRGCLLTEDGFKAYRAQRQPLYTVGDDLFGAKRTSQSTGDPAIDRQLNRAIKIAAGILEVNPAFSFYDPDRFLGENEIWGMNAFAKLVNIFPSTRGLVGFGVGRFRSELFGYDESGTTVMTIIAHEFGHILQGDWNYLDAIYHGNPLLSEINADFLAGYYIGVRKLTISGVQVEKAADVFSRLASTGPNRTHGNPEERVSAVRAGFEVGYIKRMSLPDAVRAGWRYVGYEPR